MKDIYFIIKNLLQSLDTFKYIDVDYGQLDTDKPEVSYPCALIGIQYIDCQDQTGQDQRVRASINIRMAWDITKDTASIFSDAKINQALSHLDTIEAVHFKLQGYTDGELENLSRKNMIAEKRGKGLKVINMPYETYFDDVPAL